MPVQNFAIEKSSIWKDISRIIGSPANQTFLSFSATIHTELEDYPVMMINQQDIDRDYGGNIGDNNFLTFTLTFGDYVQRFYPFINNLELTLTQNSLPQAGVSSKLTNKKSKQRFKMVFLPHENVHVNLSEYQSMDKLTLDKIDPVVVKVQLINRMLEPLRIKFTSGIYAKVKQETALRTILGSESQKILVDGKPCLDAIDIYPPDNTDIQNHIIIPSNTLVMSVPTFLQEEMNGVYNSGIGSYLQYYNQKNTLFVYPLYNTNRYVTDKTNAAKAVFYFMPAYRYGGIDNTYHSDGNIVSIVCTSDKKYIDDGETQYMNKGVGFVQADARAFMGKPVIMGANGPQGSPAQISTYVANKNRADGLNYTPVSSNAISSNSFVQYSIVNKRGISMIQLSWEHSDDSLIYPGMPCEFVYLENGQRKTVYGIIAKSKTFINKVNKGPTTSMYIRNTALLIYAQRLPQVTQAPTDIATQALDVAVTN